MAAKMLFELLTSVLGAALGSPEGFVTTLGLVMGANYLHKAATIGQLLNIGAWFVGLLGALSLTGVVSLNPEAAMALVRAVLRAVPFA